MNSVIEQPYQFSRHTGGVLIIACGALAKEIVQLVEHNNLSNIDIQCLAAKLHHRPELIPAALEQQIELHKADYQKIYVVYGDCGTAGAIDTVLARHAIERIAGPHCFSFFAGNDDFARAEDDIRTFFLTDFFCKNFEKFIWQEYNLDHGAHMVELLFGNYEKVVYLSQTEDDELLAKARAIAKKIGLEFEHRHKAYADLGKFVIEINSNPA